MNSPPNATSKNNPLPAIYTAMITNFIFSISHFPINYPKVSQKNGRNSMSKPSACPINKLCSTAKSCGNLVLRHILPNFTFVTTCSNHHCTYSGICSVNTVHIAKESFVSTQWMFHMFLQLKK